MRGRRPREPAPFGSGDAPCADPAAESTSVAGYGGDGGLESRRQHMITGSLVDSCCPALRPAVRVDGPRHRSRNAKDAGAVLKHLKQAADFIASAASRDYPLTARHHGRLCTLPPISGEGPGMGALNTATLRLAAVRQGGAAPGCGLPCKSMVRTTDRRMSTSDFGQGRAGRGNAAPTIWVGRLAAVHGTSSTA